MNDVMPGSDGLGFLVILNKSSELSLDLDEASEDSGLGEASLFVDGGVGSRVGWVSELGADDGRTVSIVKLVSVSPRVENLNLKKVIKVSYLYQESRPCFECFSDSYA